MFNLKNKFLDFKIRYSLWLEDRWDKFLIRHGLRNPQYIPVTTFGTFNYRYKDLPQGGSTRILFGLKNHKWEILSGIRELYWEEDLETGQIEGFIKLCIEDYDHFESFYKDIEIISLTSATIYNICCKADLRDVIFTKRINTICSDTQYLELQYNFKAPQGSTWKPIQ